MGAMKVKKKSPKEKKVKDASNLILTIDHVQKTPHALKFICILTKECIVYIDPIITD